MIGQCIFTMILVAFVLPLTCTYVPHPAGEQAEGVAAYAADRVRLARPAQSPVQGGGARKGPGERHRRRPGDRHYAKGTRSEHWNSFPCPTPNYLKQAVAVCRNYETNRHVTISLSNTFYFAWNHFSLNVVEKHSTMHCIYLSSFDTFYRFLFLTCFKYFSD